MLQCSQPHLDFDLIIKSESLFSPMKCDCKGTIIQVGVLFVVRVVPFATAIDPFRVNHPSKQHYNYFGLDSHIHLPVYLSPFFSSMW